MAKITRYNGNVTPFASTAQTGERLIFGDAVAVGDTLDQNIVPEWLRGWGQVGANDFPPLEWFNSAMYTSTLLASYLYQVGVPEWNGTQEYHIGSVASVGGTLYVCNTNNHVSITNPASDATNWRIDYVKLTGDQTITVNVGSGQTYTTINQALEYLSGFYPMYKSEGVTATINLKAGFVMAEQVLVRGVDLGWITIVGEDAQTTITHEALTTDFTTADYGFGSYPAFGVSKGGTSPRIGQLFIFNVQKVGDDKHGIIAVGAGSSAEVLPDKGFIGAGTSGIFAARGSTINADSANASNAGTSGIFAARGSTINARSADASGAGTYGIFALENSTINARAVRIQNQTTGTNAVMVIDGSHIGARDINTTGTTVAILSQAANTLTGNGIIYQ